VRNFSGLLLALAVPAALAADVQLVGVFGAEIDLAALQQYRKDFPALNDMKMRIEN